MLYFLNYHHHRHHHVMPQTRISLTLSRHFSLSFIASGRSSGLHPVSSHSCWMYARAGRPAFAQPYVGVHRSTSLMSSSLLLQQYPACLARPTVQVGPLFIQPLCITKYFTVRLHDIIVMQNISLRRVEKYLSFTLFSHGWLVGWYQIQFGCLTPNWVFFKQLYGFK